MCWIDANINTNSFGNVKLRAKNVFFEKIIKMKF